MTTSLPSEFTHHRDGYGVNFSYPVLEIQIDRGKTRKRHDPLSVPHVVNVSWSLDDGQYTRLMGFFRNDLDFGTLPFLMDLVTDLSVPTTHKCRCTGGLPRLVQQSGLNYKVQCTIEAFANPTYTGLLEYQAPNEVLLTTSYPAFPGAFRFGDTVRVIGAVGTHPDGDTPIDLDGVYTIGDDSTTSVDWVFDGVDDTVTHGDVLDKAAADAFSVSGWFSTSTGAGTFLDEARLFGKRGAVGNFSGWGVFMASASGHIFWSFGGPDSGGARRAEIRTNTGWIDGQAHNFVCTKAVGSTVSVMKIYIDGVLQATTTIFNTFAGSPLNTEPLAIDQFGNFQGSLFHMAVWNKELNQSEVDEVVNGGTPPDLTTTSVWANNQFWVKLDATDAVGAGGIVDHGPSGFDGTANFSPTLSASDPGLEANTMRLENPHIVNSDWTTVGTLTPDSFGPADAGNKVSSITRVPS